MKRDTPILGGVFGGKKDPYITIEFCHGLKVSGIENGGLVKIEYPEGQTVYMLAALQINIDREKWREFRLADISLIGDSSWVQVVTASDDESDYWKTIYVNRLTVPHSEAEFHYVFSNQENQNLVTNAEDHRATVEPTDELRLEFRDKIRDYERSLGSREEFTWYSGKTLRLNPPLGLSEIVTGKLSGKVKMTKKGDLLRCLPQTEMAISRILIGNPKSPVAHLFGICLDENVLAFNPAEVKEMERSLRNRAQPVKPGEGDRPTAEELFKFPGWSNLELGKPR